MPLSKPNFFLVKVLANLVSFNYDRCLFCAYVAAPFEKKAAVSKDQAPVNSSKLLTLPQDSIPMDVQFFHK